MVSAAQIIREILNKENTFDLSCDKQVACHKVVNIQHFKKVNSISYRLILERNAIETIQSNKEKAIALAVWWQRFNCFTESYPDYFVSTGVKPPLEVVDA